MGFIFTNEQKELRKAMANFALKEIKPYAITLDEREEFRKETFEKLGELGYLGVTVDPEYGGSGLGATEAGIITEEISRYCASTGLSYLAHAILCANNINKNGTPEQKAKYLPDLCSGKKIGGMAITEPESGSDSTSITTKAVKKGDYYVLNGRKTFITNGPVGETFVVYAKTKPEDKKHGISSFIVEKSYTGCYAEKKFTKMGMHASPTSDLVFEECYVPLENLLGEANKGVIQLMICYEIERVVISAISLGIARQSYYLSRKYAMTRKQFDKNIIDFQLVSKLLSDMKIAISASHFLIYYAASLVDAGKPANAAASEAKIFAADAGVKAAADAIQIHGGYGYMREYEVERFSRDAKLLNIGAGTNEIQYVILQREMMKE